MRIFELLTVVIEHAVPPCTEASRADIEKLLVQHEEVLANYEVLSASARSEMIASLREELIWRARLHSCSRSLETAGIQWMTAQQEMLDRLELDRAQMELQFFADQRTGQISSISLDLSDRHEGARTVAIVTFVSGGRLVYKPRSLEAESWFYNFLAGVNELTPPFSFAELKVLRRENYGWVEFTEHRPCFDDAELRNYYRHAGALLCLLRLLRTSDCHFQNLIASGPMPVFIDAETIFQAGRSEEPGFSVADTAMLPSVQRPYDLGALSCVTPQQIVLDLPGLAPSPITLAPRENLPYREGQPSLPHLYVEQMAEGFALTGSFFAMHRERVAGLIESAKSLPVRILPRDTPEYYRQILLLALDMEPDTALTAAELESLRRFEVPRFATKADVAENGLTTSGLEAVLQEITVLDDTVLERQLKMLRLLWTIYGSMRGMAAEAVKIAPA